jgi:hypothetical protein
MGRKEWLFCEYVIGGAFKNLKTSSRTYPGLDGNPISPNTGFVS